MIARSHTLLSNPNYLKCPQMRPPSSAEPFFTVITPSPSKPTHSSLTPPLSPLLLPQIPREIPLPHRRCHLLRPRRQRNPLSKTRRKEEHPLFPLATPSPSHHRTVHPHQRRLFRPRSRRPHFRTSSQKSRRVGNTKSEQSLRSPLHNRCLTTRTPRTPSLNSEYRFKSIENPRTDRIRGGYYQFK